MKKRKRNCLSFEPKWLRNVAVVAAVAVAVAGAVAVDWSVILQEQLLLERLTSANLFFVDKMCFCFTSNESFHFSSEKRLPPQNLVVDLLLENTHSEKHQNLRGFLRKK